MYRTVKDFLFDWTAATQGTVQVLEAMTDDKLDQAIAEGHNTLGWLGWHLANSPLFFGGLVGLNVSPAGDSKVVPSRASEIVEGYKKVAESLKNEVENNLTDETIVEKVESPFGLVPRGAMLRVMIDHQTHHRGQMTVLLRQAGLTVPGVMGPTKEQK
jgi:uncharacterized damage-inducible protein DinB